MLKARIFETGGGGKKKGRVGKPALFEALLKAIRLSVEKVATATAVHVAISGRTVRLLTVLTAARWISKHNGKSQRQNKDQKHNPGHYFLHFVSHPYGFLSFYQNRHPHPTRNAKRGDASFGVPFLHREKERGQNPRSGGADGVTKSDRPAVDV